MKLFGALTVLCYISALYAAHLSDDVVNRMVEDIMEKIEHKHRKDPAVETFDCSHVCSIGTLYPVCGSDGVTYSSKCILRKHACSKPDLRWVSDGPCEDMDRRTALVERVVKDISAKLKVKPTEKDPMMAPLPVGKNPAACIMDCKIFSKKVVCGSDGNDYINICALKQKACELKLHGSVLTKHRDGPCNPPRVIPVEDICDMMQCEPAPGLMDPTMKICAVTPMKIYKNFPSKCHMLKFMCKHKNAKFELSHFGDCKVAELEVGGGLKDEKEIDRIADEVYQRILEKLDH